MKIDNTRRHLLMRLAAAAAAAVAGGCSRLSDTGWFPRLLRAGEKLSDSVQHLIVPRRSMAQEFTEADLSPRFRSNGTDMPQTADYAALAKSGFSDYRLEVAGLAQRPRSFTLAELKALPSRTQITRHDCVEGWSAIGKWKGARLSAVLDEVGLQPGARYIVFRCADPMDQDGSNYYYESIDLEDAFHEQTLLAYELNDQPLPIANGAPIRLRVERQLGYKMAKYVMRIELVDSFERIRGGKGGYWEDLGYQWYAGI